MAIKNRITRIDDTPVHKAVREALVNCIVNTDYFLPQGVVIRKESDTLTIENPGSIRTGKKQMLRGGISDPKNKTLMKMFNLIGIGERAGSGIPDIYQVWKDEGWEAPKVKERFNPDRTVLTLSFTKADDKVAEKSGEKTQEKYDAILKYMQHDKWYKASEFESIVGVKESRVKILLKDMTEQGLIEGTGSTKGKMYKKLN
jgi:predicted HTH transcriptional regulator